MAAADDLIRRQEAIACIHAEMKRTYTAARRQGYKMAMEILARVPSAKAMPITMALPVTKSPGVIHSHWFNASGWMLCDNCGGRNAGWKPTPYCPHCGARMDELHDAEIE